MLFKNKVKIGKVGVNSASFLFKDPYRDWRMLLSVFFCLLVFALGVGAYLFLGVRKGELFIVAPSRETTLQTIDQIFLKEIQQDFDEKNEKFKELIRSRIEIEDPSI